MENDTHAPSPKVPPLSPRVRALFAEMSAVAHAPGFRAGALRRPAPSAPHPSPLQGERAGARPPGFTHRHAEGLRALCALVSFAAFGVTVQLAAAALATLSR